MEKKYTAREVLELVHDLVGIAMCNYEGNYEVKHAVMQIECDAVGHLLAEETLEVAYLHGGSKE